MEGVIWFHMSWPPSWHVSGSFYKWRSKASETFDKMCLLLVYRIEHFAEGKLSSLLTGNIFQKIYKKT